MADANHNAPVSFHDCFVPPRMSLQTRRIVPHLRLSDMAPPVLHLWMKLSGRWIEAAGFEPEQRLQIEVTHKRLVITPIDEGHGDDVGQDADRATRQPRPQFSVITGGAE
ncbi:SymE family type I addiction module toxin [Burkholderia sp. Ac-20349]|uniref:SymE family type I addiction module toxin n=1 Tax=Burkholderia sp. Ac-20349 TaxID=2703893 RepID=UPI00197C0D93|nr:SymE family type I addiction module toxin [Burkholderia sp. Ac-20349]MBN3843907.1 type I toxin-antitoxin system SymE family toxin [Burkholderia sp. Ac-20349]